uniref:Uncharacterized protein n=1 Tax=Ditylenchus dipsaci TaxID=166011 RepID=A0A915D435_9BILA
MAQLAVYITILSIRHYKLKKSEQKETVFHLMKFIEQEDWHLEVQYNAYIEQQDALLKKKLAEAEAEAKKNPKKKPSKKMVAKRNWGAKNKLI